LRLLRRAFGASHVGPPDEERTIARGGSGGQDGIGYRLTSVNRDDQPDGGAHIFARTIEEIRRPASPAAKSKCSFLIFAVIGMR